jgi:GGDEF domain-containing protein
MRWSTLSGNGTENTLRQVAALLLAKIGESVVQDDPGALNTFRGEMSAVCKALTPDLPPENLLVLAGSATEVLETYNRQITRTLGRQNKAYQAIIRMFQDSLVKIAGANTECVQSLNSIGKDLERGIGFKDLLSLKAQLDNCLSGLVKAAEHEKNTSKALIEKLQIEIESFHKPAPKLPQGKVDAAGGPLVQKDCVAAIKDAIDRGTRHYAVVMVVNRVQPISARFGREAGDWMLARFKEYVETELTPSDRLFRWIGPAMVAILERPQPLDQVRGLIRRMLDSPLQKTYDSGGRSVLITLSAAWSVITLASTPEATEQQIETFIGAHGCRDFV